MFLAPVNFLHTYPDIDSSQTIFNQPCDVAAAERLFNDRCDANTAHGLTGLFNNGCGNRNTKRIRDPVLGFAEFCAPGLTNLFHVAANILYNRLELLLLVGANLHIKIRFLWDDVGLPGAEQIGHVDNANFRHTAAFDAGNTLCLFQEKRPHVRSFLG